MKTPLTLIFLGLALAVSRGAPYASSLKNNGDGTGTFILNESADSVKVVLAGGPATVDLGALPAGTHTFNRGAALVWHVEAAKSAGPGWRQGVLQQISSDANDLAKFANARGVAVNRIPSHPAFGRVYVSVAQENAAFVPPVADGIYVRNADFSASALGSGALAGSLFSNSTDPTVGGPAGTSSPYRLSIGDDGSVFVSDWSNINGGLYMLDADCANGQPVLTGATGNFPLGEGAFHGSISAAVTTGTLGNGDLKVWVVDEDFQADLTSSTQTERNSIWQWDILNQPLPVAGPPVKFTGVGIGFASQDCDLARLPDGRLLKSQRRSVGNEFGVAMISPDGITLAASLADWRAYSNDLSLTDVFAETQGIEVSPDGKTLAIVRRDNALHIVPLTETGFNFADRRLMVTAPATAIGRDVAFDAAYNLYTISSGQLVLRAYAPGGKSRAVTGSDGSFNIFFEKDPAAVTGITVADNMVTVGFRRTGGVPAEFELQSSTDLLTWTSVPAAEIAGTDPDFTATTPFTGDVSRYYRIKRN